MMTETIEGLLKKLDIPFDYNGRYFKIRCINPEHEDINPSMSILGETGYFKCWSCGHKGSFKRFCLELGVNPETLNIPEDWDLSNNKSQKQMANLWSEYDDGDHTVKVEGEFQSVYGNLELMKYLRRRFVNDSFIEDFELGYCDNVLINGSMYYDRLAIPIYLDGELVCVELRDYTGRSEKKVLYPKHGYTNFIFNWDNLDLSKTVILTEGLFDLTGLYHITDNVASCFGSSMTNQKLEYIKKIPDLVIAPDNDDAGFGLVKAIERARTSDYKVMVLPKDKKDPGECSPDELMLYFSHRIVSASEYFLYKMGILNLEETVW